MIVDSLVGFDSWVSPHSVGVESSHWQHHRDTLCHKGTNKKAQTVPTASSSNSLMSNATTSEQRTVVTCKDSEKEMPRILQEGFTKTGMLRFLDSCPKWSVSRYLDHQRIHVSLRSMSALPMLYLRNHGWGSWPKNNKRGTRVDCGINNICSSASLQHGE